MLNRDAAKRAFIDAYERAISPWTKGKGIDWEIQIEENNVSSPPLSPSFHPKLKPQFAARILEPERDVTPYYVLARYGRLESSK